MANYVVCGSAAPLFAPVQICTRPLISPLTVRFLLETDEISISAKVVSQSCTQSLSVNIRIPVHLIAFFNAINYVIPDMVLIKRLSKRLIGSYIFDWIAIL
jgi:hypothetical protein